jgi:nucleoside 2-deoxyribosyltransferase
MNHKEVFISGAIKHSMPRSLRQELTKLCIQAGFQPFNAQILRHPYSKDQLKLVNLQTETALRQANVIIVIIDSMGPSTIMETGMAWILQKPLLFLGNESQSLGIIGSHVASLMETYPTFSTAISLVQYLSNNY